MGQLYLLTGAAGHLGTALLRQLAAQQKNVRALVLPGETHLAQLSSGSGVEVVYGDVRNLESLEPFFSNPNEEELIVIHAAGIVSIASGHIQMVHDVNVGGTRNILSCAKNTRSNAWCTSALCMPSPRPLPANHSGSKPF